MNKLSVSGHPDLVRDSQSRAVINKNNTEYESYIKIHRTRQSEKDRLSNMEQDLNDLKFDIDEIKQLLLSLSNK